MTSFVKWRSTQEVSHIIMRFRWSFAKYTVTNIKDGMFVFLLLSSIFFFFSLINLQQSGLIPLRGSISKPAPRHHQNNSSTTSRFPTPLSTVIWKTAAFQHVRDCSWWNGVKNSLELMMEPLLSCLDKHAMVCCHLAPVVKLCNKAEERPKRDTSPGLAQYTHLFAETNG